MPSLIRSRRPTGKTRRASSGEQIRHGLAAPVYPPMSLSDAPGLVDFVRDVALGLFDGLAVHGDLHLVRVHFGPQLGDDLAVHLHPAVTVRSSQARRLATPRRP